MLTWTDTTSHSQAQTHHTPNTWSACVGRFRLVVTRAHIYHPGHWVGHIFPGLEDCWDLHLSGEKPPEAAQAIMIVRMAAILGEAQKALADAL